MLYLCKYVKNVEMLYMKIYEVMQLDQQRDQQHDQVTSCLPVQLYLLAILR